MSDKLIWSNTMTQNYLCGLPEDDLRAELVDYGYEEDMLDTLDYKGLQQLVMDDDYMWQHDEEDFEYSVAPEISDQTKDGIVLFAGTAAGWNGNRKAGIAGDLANVFGERAFSNCDNLEFYDEDGAVVLRATHHDGTHVMGLYALPEDYDTFINFMNVCMQDYMEEIHDYNNPEASDDEIFQYAYDTIDAELINNYCDFSKVPEVCEPIHYDNFNEDLNKDEIDAITKDIANAEKDFINPTAKERKAGPGYDRAVSKHGGYGYGEDLDEAKSKNPENLAMELQSIKDDYEDFGPEGFYAVPFKRFQNQYPEFTKSCIMTYLKELEILEPEELADPEIFDEYWQSGELIIPEDWPILLDGANRLSTDRADKGYTWITLLKKYNRPFDEPEEESLQEAVDDLTVPAEILDLGEYETYISGSGLQDYGFYQGDVMLDNEYDAELVNKIRDAGLQEGDEVLVKLEEVEDEEYPYKVVDIIVKGSANESLKEGLFDGLQGAMPDQAVVVVQPEQNCTMQTATAVMAAYQNANKWLDIVKEIVYTNIGCVFFSSFIHGLAHTMPGRFDKFGDILHTVNMRIPYPPTAYIPQEPASIDEVFGCIFMCLDAIKAALNDFIRCTDETAHGMACAAEALLNDIEGEYPAIFRMQQEWQNSAGNVATFDKYVGQYVEHKGDLLESLQESVEGLEKLVKTCIDKGYDHTQVLKYVKKNLKNNDLSDEELIKEIGKYYHIK